MTFHELEWGRPVLVRPNGIIIYMRYDNKFFYRSESINDWVEIEPNYEYVGYVYCDGGR